MAIFALKSCARIPKFNLDSLDIRCFTDFTMRVGREKGIRYRKFLTRGGQKLSATRPLGERGRRPLQLYYIRPNITKQFSIGPRTTNPYLHSFSRSFSGSTPRCSLLCFRGVVRYILLGVYALSASAGE